jgi:hypothetical protein
VIGAVQSKNRPVESEPSRRFNLLFTVEGSGIQGSALHHGEELYSGHYTSLLFEEDNVVEVMIHVLNV